MVQYENYVFLLRGAQENQLPAELRCGVPVNPGDDMIEKILRWIWKDQAEAHAEQLIKLTRQAHQKLGNILNI